MYVTWGESDDILTDWKVASEAAAAELAMADPDGLVIVSGLCFTFDLRALHDDPPTTLQQNKLVFTTHGVTPRSNSHRRPTFHPR
jgi:hypothetical protein